jgi:hypothetical protein
MIPFYKLKPFTEQVNKKKEAHPGHKDMAPVLKEGMRVPVKRSV